MVTESLTEENYFEKSNDGTQKLIDTVSLIKDYDKKLHNTENISSQEKIKNAVNLLCLLKILITNYLVVSCRHIFVIFIQQYLMKIRQ